MKSIKVFLTSFGFLFLSHFVHGNDLVELRIGAGISGADTNSFNINSVVNSNVLEVNNLSSYNLDLFINIPVLPIGAGLRYESSKEDNNTSALGVNFDTELDVSVVSLLIDWRIIDTFVYVGPIVGIGMADGDFDIKTAAGTTSFDLDSNGLSYSAGVEAGVRIRRFILGGEVGYQSLRLENNIDLTIDGIYGKVLVGVTFL